MNETKPVPTVRHRIRVRLNGGYYAVCDCGKFITGPVYATAKEAHGAGKDHLSEVR